MITVYQKLTKEAALQTSNDISQDFSKDFWIHAEAPDEHELLMLAEKFSLEKGLLSDAVDPNEVPRLEIQEEIIYFFTRVPYEEEGRIFSVPFMIALKNGALVTVSSHHLLFLEKFTQGKIVFSTVNRIKLFLLMLLEITSVFNKFLNDIQRRVRSASVSITHITNNDIIQFVTFESVLNDFVSALTSTNDGLQSILHSKPLPFRKDEEELLKDVILGNEQLIKTAVSNNRMIVNISNAYSTIMTNNLNHVIKILTVLTIVLTIPMIVASFYGMNVHLPLSSSPFAFWIVMGITGVISIISLAVFFAKRWM